jgi:hypothetical protein
VSELLRDDEGENIAVRMFLLGYGMRPGTVGSMRRHMERSGYPYWPEWAAQMDEAHLTKAGAQSWLRHLFALEQMNCRKIVENAPQAIDSTGTR